MGRKMLPSRRMILGGAGAAIALPFLKSLVPRSMAGGGSIAAAGSPKRLLAYYVPCGIHMPAWRPAASGSDYELSPTLAPLADFKEKLLVLSGVANRPAQPDGPGDHAAGTGSFLTCAHVYKTEGADIKNGISMDQVAANHLRQYTRFASLQLGIDGGNSQGNCDSGYSCAYARNISWAGPQTPMPKQVNPRAVFDLLFAGFDPGATLEEQMRRQRRDLSVLDTVVEDTKSLSNKLSTRDKLKLDEYLTGLNELESRVASDAVQVCEPGERPPDGGSVQARIDLMTDLMALAFQCDMTRVISFMLANAGSGRNYDFIGVTGGHHQLSHHQNQQAAFDGLSKINFWEVQQLAKLCAKLDAIPEGEGTTALDNTFIFFSSEISDGNRHNHNDMPVLVLGSGGGAFNSGRHVDFGTEVNMADLFITMLRGLDVPNVNTFGDDGTGELSELRA